MLFMILITKRVFLKNIFGLFFFALPVTDLTDKLTYHCGLCLRNISRAACMILGDGVLSCVKCKEYNLHEDGMQCGHCPTKVDGTVIGLPTRGSCETCVCNGTVDANQLKGCDDLDRSRCFVCRPNSTGILCKHCADDSKLHLCATKQTDDNVEPQRRSGQFLLQFNITMW